MGKTSFASKAFAARLFCLTVVFTIFTIAIAGCSGGGGSTSMQITTTVTAVTVSPTTGTVTAGGNATFTAAVSGQDNPSQIVSWGVNPTTAGTITAGGVFTASATITATSTATITATSTVPGYTNITGTAIVTINPATVPQPTVTIAAVPLTITLGATTTLTWSSTNTTSCTASGAWSGTEVVSGSATETPSATGTATYTLACTGAGGSATASASVTVDAAPLPNITSIVPNTLYLEAEALFVPIQINGSDFAPGQTMVLGAPWNTDSTIPQGFSSTQLAFTASFDTPHFSPGFITMDVCENANGTNCGTSGTLAFLGARNDLATSSSGELFFLDQAQGAPSGQNGYVRKYKADGTADGKFFVGALFHSIAVDGTTGNVLVDADDYDEDGGTTVPLATQLASLDQGGAVAAENGYGCFTQPDNNSASCYDLVGGLVAAPVCTASNLGNYPDPIAMGTFGTETDAFVVSLNDAPTPLLHMVRASDAYTGEEPALALKGITPMSQVQAANSSAGGVQVVVFDSGPASGIIAVLSTYDNLLLLVDKSTWKITASVKVTGMSGVSGTPFRIVADTADGAVIVAYANPASATTTYSSVSAASGTVTPLTSSSSLLSVGLAVSSDGTKLYSGQRNQLQVENNQ